MCRRAENRKRKETDGSGNIARERLRLILDAEKQKLDDDTLRQIQQEIGGVITKYVDIEPENIEVKVILKGYSNSSNRSAQLMA